MTTPIVYEAAVYSREISYKNFNGELKTSTLHFQLPPLKLMAVLSGYTPKKIKSGNPALNGKDADFTDEQQITIVRELAIKSVGTPREDGEGWIPFEDFDTSVVGEAFMTKLVSSDADRKEFSEKVVLAPFKAFVGYASDDPTNSKTEIAGLQDMLTKLENVFKGPAIGSESPEARRERLQQELKALEATPES